MVSKHFFLKHRVIIAIISLLIPVTVIFIWITRTSTMQIENQIAYANKDSLRLYLNTLQLDIMNTESFLGTLVYGNEVFEEFAQDTDGSDGTVPGGGQAYKSVSREQLYETKLSSVLEEGFNNKSGMTALLLYNPKTDFFKVKLNSVVFFENKGSELFPLIKRQKEKDIPLGWYIEQSGAYHYLCRLVKKNDYYVMGIYNLEQMAANASIFYNQEGELVFFRDKELLANEKLNQKVDLDLAYNTDKNHYFIGNGREYMVVQEHLINFKVALIKTFAEENGSIRLLYLSPILYIAVALMTFSIVVHYLEKALFAPLGNLVKTMERIQKGELTARLDEQKGEEFSKVQKTFNSMISELSTLRIKSYEQQLEVQRSQLNVLRMQIRPHFYLNCLKSIFGLAQSGSMAKIQKAVLYLSTHLRYVMDIQTDTIPLEKELQMCENYISLQNECECSQAEIKISIDTRVMGVKIPPVSLLTLVENSVKYGVVRDMPLEVCINIKQLEVDGEKIVDINIRDNGPGFSGRILEELEEKPDKPSANGIGLPNIMKRFHMLYGDRCVIRFFNAEGACVEILIRS